MSRGLKRSQYEAQLAVASRALYRASELAAEVGDEGAADDALQIKTELSRLLEDSVNGRKRRRRQLTLPDSSCA